MDIQELQAKLRTIPQLKDFVWDKDNFGIKEMLVTTFKDSGKNEYRLGNNYSIFLAHMYPEQLEGQPDEFFYVTLHRRSERRDFRRHSFYPIEFNRRFISGETVEIIYDKFVELFANDHDPYRFI